MSVEKKKTMSRPNLEKYIKEKTEQQNGPFFFLLAVAHVGSVHVIKLKWKI